MECVFAQWVPAARRARILASAAFRNASSLSSSAHVVRVTVLHSLRRCLLTGLRLRAEDDPVREFEARIREAPAAGPGRDRGVAPQAASDGGAAGDTGGATDTMYGWSRWHPWLPRGHRPWTKRRHSALSQFDTGTRSGTSCRHTTRTAQPSGRCHKVPHCCLHPTMRFRNALPRSACTAW